MTGYDAHARARWIAEPPKNPSRDAFARDRARVLHSAALRRLAAKTQVVEPWAGDFPRTRLTHSLECAQIGRDLGAVLGCAPDVVDAGCLAHDLGHPPFGHNGEAALDAIAAPCGGFEGNAQSLRLLTRLEAKVFAPDGRSAGLNLTRAVLDASLKYPWPRQASGSSRKYGVYADDLDVFHWIREGAPQGRPCFEAQVMDWADDVAYSVHDLEDALHSGHLTLAELRDPLNRRAIAKIAATSYCVADLEELEETFVGLLDLPFWPEGYDGTMRALAALKRLTSELIGRFCRAAEQATRAAHGERPLTRYDADLVVPRRQRLECALLKAVTAHHVMSHESQEALRARQRDLVTELAAQIARRAPDSLEPALREAYVDAHDDAARLRVVVDQVAVLTDTSALAWHRRLRAR